MNRNEYFWVIVLIGEVFIGIEGYCIVILSGGVVVSFGIVCIVFFKLGVLKGKVSFFVCERFFL